MNDLSRRAFLSAIGTGVGAVWLAAETGQLLAAGSHALAAARTTPPPPFEVELLFAMFTPHIAAYIQSIHYMRHSGKNN